MGVVQWSPESLEVVIRISSSQTPVLRLICFSNFVELSQTTKSFPVVGSIATSSSPSPTRSRYVDHLVILVDGPIEVPLDGAMEEEDLVDVPTAAKPTTMPGGRGRELWTEGLGPSPSGGMAHAQYGNLTQVDDVHSDQAALVDRACGVQKSDRGRAGSV
jgi:hypothetical protein